MMWNILRAMETIMNTTCISFVVRKPFDFDYIKFVSDPKRCNSKVGRVGGVQKLKLRDECNKLYAIIHELNHALGFSHEHKRYDRDDYVTILPDNIKPGQEHNFVKVDPEMYKNINKFDFQSIMLYGSTSFSKQRGEKTMLRLNGTEIRKNKNLSPSDIVRINLLYDCPFLIDEMS
ncbi:BMP1 [Cordylochernes scorpioides]|uniref:Metalloendopeptidase n=1 Tax=Cordylochernes scorpioides TaxID=51811 RepID=A0ABY6KI89_9ARAC|nr:BMP1 [Cordylochernes scorpioides]